MGVFEFDDDRVEELKHVAMFQRGMNTHLLVNGFALFVGGAGCKSDDLASGDTMFGQVNRTEHAVEGPMSTTMKEN